MKIQALNCLANNIHYHTLRKRMCVDVRHICARETNKQTPESSIARCRQPSLSNRPLRARAVYARLLVAFSHHIQRVACTCVWCSPLMFSAPQKYMPLCSVWLLFASCLSLCKAKKTTRSHSHNLVTWKVTSFWLRERSHSRPFLYHGFLHIVTCRSQLFLSLLTLVRCFGSTFFFTLSLGNVSHELYSRILSAEQRCLVNYKIWSNHSQGYAPPLRAATRW